MNGWASSLSSSSTESIYKLMYKVQELKSRDHLLEATDLKYRLPVCSDTLLVCIAEWVSYQKRELYLTINQQGILLYCAAFVAFCRCSLSLVCIFLCGGKQEILLFFCEKREHYNNTLQPSSLWSYLIQFSINLTWHKTIKMMIAKILAMDFTKMCDMQQAFIINGH